MGLGDDLLAAGQAKLLHQETGKKVIIGSGSRPTINPLFKFIPYLTGPKDPKAIWLLDWPGARGYHDPTQTKRPKGGAKRVTFRPEYRAEPAQIEIEPIQSDYIIIEPRVKSAAPNAKLWTGYQEVVNAFPDERFMQFMPESTINMKGPMLDGVTYQVTSVIHAAQWIAGCKAYVGNEGFLNHLAAAFNIPAVVVVGSFSPPKVIGYDYQTQIVRDDPEKLGHRGMDGSMGNITPSEVIEALRQYCG